MKLLAGHGLGKQLKLGDYMKIGKNYYYVNKAEFFGIYGFLIILPLILKYIYLERDMPFFIYLKLAFTDPLNLIFLIFITWVAFKSFVHKYDPNEMKKN